MGKSELKRLKIVGGGGGGGALWGVGEYNNVAKYIETQYRRIN